GDLLAQVRDPVAHALLGEFDVAVATRGAPSSALAVVVHVLVADPREFVFEPGEFELEPGGVRRRPRLADAQDHLRSLDHPDAERRAQVATLPRRELVVGDDEEIRAQALEVGLRPARKLAGSAREPGEFLELSFSNVRDAGGLDSALHDPVGDTDTEAPQEVFELRQGAADVRILHLGELDGHENRAEFSRGRVAKRRHVDLRNQKRWRSRIAWLDR